MFRKIYFMMIQIPLTIVLVEFFLNMLKSGQVVLWGKLD